MLWLLIGVVLVIVVVVGAFIMYGPVVGIITVILLPLTTVIYLVLIKELCKRLLE